MLPRVPDQLEDDRRHVDGDPAPMPCGRVTPRRHRSRRTSTGPPRSRAPRTRVSRSSTCSRMKVRSRQLPESRRYPALCPAEIASAGASRQRRSIARRVAGRLVAGSTQARGDPGAAELVLLAELAARAGADQDDDPRPARRDRVGLRASSCADEATPVGAARGGERQQARPGAREEDRRPLRVRVARDRRRAVVQVEAVRHVPAQLPDQERLVEQLAAGASPPPGLGTRGTGGPPPRP